MSDNTAKQEQNEAKKRKRGQGEGTISKRMKNGVWDGTWWARISLGRDENGKQKRRAFYGKSRKEVQEKLTAALNDINNDTYIEPSKMTVAEWVDIWLKDYKKNSIRASTYSILYSSNKNHITPKLGKYKLRELRNDMIQQFINDLVDRSYSRNTIDIIFSCLYGALEQAFENELISKNPSSKIKLPKAEKKEKRVLTQQEQDAFVNVAKHTKYGRLFIVILSTGLRRGEALALTWDDVDFKNCQLRVNKTITKDKLPGIESEQTWLIGPTKTQSSNRTIPLLPSTIKIFNEVKREQNEERLRLGSEYIDNNLIFCTPRGTLLDPRNTAKRLRDLLEASGLPKGSGITIHSLRHTFATRGLENGIELKVMQELLGHSSIKMTADTYTHVLEDKKAQSMMKLKDTINI